MGNTQGANANDIAAHHAYHYRADPDGDGLFNDYNSTELTTVLSDLSENFHTYGVEWSEGLLVYFDEAGAGFNAGRESAKIKRTLKWG